MIGDEFSLDLPPQIWNYFEHATGYRYIKSKEELDAVKSIGQEFCISHTFHPKFIDEVCLHGYFPMSINLASYYVMAVKVHLERCVLKLENLHVERRARKNAGKYEMSMDTAFEEVVQLIVAKHGENWLCTNIQKAFRFMFNHPNEFKTKIHSCEMWCDGLLVAGELGYVVGDIYTSLTGAYQLAGTGSVQLCTLGKFLKQKGYELWDFGMAMDYKLNLGSTVFSRNQWLALHKQHRDRESPSLKIEGKKRAREIIDYDQIQQQPIPRETEKKRKRNEKINSQKPSKKVDEKEPKNHQTEKERNTQVEEPKSDL